MVGVVLGSDGRATPGAAHEQAFRTRLHEVAVELPLLQVGHPACIGAVHLCTGRGMGTQEPGRQLPGGGLGIATRAWGLGGRVARRA